MKENFHEVLQPKEIPYVCNYKKYLLMNRDFFYL